jgi:molybdopterin-guanine dinucleotide biosynthesis protein A
LDVEEMLLKNQLSLQALLKKIRTRRIATEELVDIDPELESLRNLNTPADYHAALAAAGLADENRIS